MTNYPKVKGWSREKIGNSILYTKEIKSGKVLSARLTLRENIGYLNIAISVCGVTILSAVIKELNLDLASDGIEKSLSHLKRCVKVLKRLPNISHEYILGFFHGKVTLRAAFNFKRVKKLAKESVDLATKTTKGKVVYFYA